MVDVLTPLTATAALTTNAAPALGKVNRYNASAGAMTVTLPALSGVAAGRVVVVQKDELDTSTNVVTVACAGSDTLDSGGAVIPLRIPGSQRKLQVVTVGSTKYWKVVGGHDPLSSLDKRFTPSGATAQLRCGSTGDSTMAGYQRSPDGIVLTVSSRPTATVPIDEQGICQGGPSSWFVHMCLQSGGRLINVFNGGIGDDTTRGMLARFDTDILTKRLDVVFIGNAHNDFGAGSDITEAETRSNITAMVAKARSASIIPVINTCYPDNQTQYAATLRKHNAWLRKFASENRLMLIDLYAAVTDPASTTGAWKSGMSSDGTHASHNAAKIAGKAALDQMGGLLRGNPAAPVWLPIDRVGGAGPQRLLNPLFQDDVNFDGIADGFTVTTSGTQRTLSDAAVTVNLPQLTSSSGAFTSDDLGRAVAGTGIPANAVVRSVDSPTQITMNVNATATGSGLSVTLGNIGRQLVTDAAVLGKAQRILISGGATAFYQQVNVDGTNIAVGDRLKWAGLFKATGAAAGALKYSIELSFPGVSSYVVRPLVQIDSVDYDWSYYEVEAVVPSGATILRPGASTTSGTGVLWFAQQGLWAMKLV